MSCLVRNCRGLGNPCIVIEPADLVQAKDLSIVFSAETWADKARLKNVLRGGNLFIDLRSNMGGGLVLFWRSTIDVVVKGWGTNYIDTMFQEEDSAGIGVIIRDCQGKGLAHMVGIIPLPLTIMELETLATSKALQFDADLSLKDVIPKGDSEIAINALNVDSHSLESFGLAILGGDSLNLIKALTSAECSLSPIGLVIDDVKRVANIFVRLLYSHVKRNGNRVAHSLAKNALRIPDFQVWMEDVPLHIVLILHSDVVDSIQ